MTRTQITAVGERLYDQGHTDIGDLVAAIARAVGPANSLASAITAAQVIKAKTTQAATAVTSPVSAVTDVTSAIRDTAELPTRILRWLGDPGTWVRIAYVGAGLTLIVVAGALAVSGSKGAKTVIKTVQKGAS